MQDLYGVEISPGLISNVTDAVEEERKLWQNRTLDPVYPIVYFDAIGVKVRQDGRVINKAIHLALGVNLAGTKELLGLWMTQNESALILAFGFDRTSKPRGQGHLYRLL
ncbi:MAG: hypothetical protein HC895_25680 [Leptolyngbyaceae cyanobacterium SM1_3_5]|nr:hypothetical protein [Leptolyngbyaceae cyanobacterium SM1_3_5]